MKVFIHYEEPAAESLRQTLKITLPKKWETGPASNLLDTFVKNYNAKHPENSLTASQLRMETEMREVVMPGATVCEKIHDRADLYVKFGAAPPPPRRATGAPAAGSAAAAGVDPLDQQRSCKMFGCNKKYCERSNFDGECRHHTKPPVFHETAKYWSCCPHKKAYDWESFMEIKGCAYGKHSDVKPGAANVALGGSHVRGQVAGSNPNLKKIEDFNSGRATTTPLEALKQALLGVGCSAADWDKALEVLKEKFNGDEKEITAELATEFGFGLHNLIGTTAPAGGGATGPPQFAPPPNFAP